MVLKVDVENEEALISMLTMSSFRDTFGLNLHG